MKMLMLAAESVVASVNRWHSDKSWELWDKLPFQEEITLQHQSHYQEGGPSLVPAP